MIELIGFENQINNLLNKFNNNNLHSSIIIHGPKGIGKRIFIENFIDKIFKNKFEKNNYFHHINLFNNKTHPNVKLLEKEIDNKTKKIKLNITIDQIRNLKNFINSSASIKNLDKFIIIDSGDDLNINSSNSLLKTLEEPKNNTYIFLISHQLSSLIPTIRSRCLKVKLNKHGFENFQKILKSNIKDITDNELKFYYDLSLGCPGNAFKFYEDNVINHFDLIINSFFSSKIDDDSINLINNLSKMDNDEFKSYLSFIKFILVTMNKIKTNNYILESYLSDKFKYLKNIPYSISKKNIIDRFNFLSNNELDLFTYNLDKKLFMLKFLNT